MNSNENNGGNVKKSSPKNGLKNSTKSTEGKFIFFFYFTQS